jgi:hypothetical protein
VTPSEQQNPGLGFVSLQTLSYYGYINVDHVAIKKDFKNFLDLNEDGKIRTGRLPQQKFWKSSNSTCQLVVALWPALWGGCS